MAYRTLTDHDGREWRYTIGDTYVKLRSPNDNTFLPTHAAIAGIDASDRAHDGILIQITPAMLKDWIKGNVVDDPVKVKKKKK